MKKLDIVFTKMTGAGNDFILIDNRNVNYLVDWSKAAPLMCHRHNGIGADGLLILEKSTIAQFKMSYFNSDGTSGGMCGNGGRCSASFIMNRLSVSEIKFEAINKIYYAERSGNDINLKMQDPKIFYLNKLLKIVDDMVTTYFVDTGAPHVVIFKEDLTAKFLKSFELNGLKEIGPLIRYHNEYKPNGTNVNIIEVRNSNALYMRTYERGVEHETLACGTGAIAAAVIGVLQNRISFPVDIITFGDETLRVSFRYDKNTISDVHLIGSARIVFEGSFSYDYI